MDPAVEAFGVPLATLFLAILENFLTCQAILLPDHRAAVR